MQLYGMSMALLLLVSCASARLNENISVKDVQGDIKSGNMQSKDTTDYDTVEEVENNRPGLHEAAIDDSNPVDLVLQSTKENTIEPEKHNINLSSIHYQYRKNIVYTVYTAENKITDIVLRKSEQLQSEIVIGNATNFEIGTGFSIESGSEIQHIYIMPFASGVTTTMIIPTNERTYYLNIETYKYTHMVKVFWSYPELKLQERRLQKENERYLPDINLENVNFNYSFKSRKRFKDLPKWAPKIIFDDGKRTFIKIENLTTIPELPIAYYQRGDDKFLINYRIQGLYYIIDGVYDNIILTTDEKDVNAVIILINKKLR